MTNDTAPEVAALQAEVAELREVVARLQAKLDTTPAPAPSAGPTSRRDLLKLAGGVAVGAAGVALLAPRRRRRTQEIPSWSGTLERRRPGDRPRVPASITQRRGPSSHRRASRFSSSRTM